MKKELLMQICQSFTTISMIGVYMIKNEKCINISSQASKYNLAQVFINDFSSRTEEINIFSSSEFILFGIIRWKNVNIAIGPAIIGNPTMDDARSIILSHPSSHISLKELEQFFDFLKTLPSMSYRQFLDYIKFLYQAISHNLITDIKDIDPLYKISDEASDAVTTADLLAFQKNQYMEFADSVNYDFENKLIYFVKHGYVDELLDYTSEFRYTMGRMGNDALSHTKNAVRVLNTLIQRAAIAGGLDAKTSYGLGSIYAQSIEDATNISTLTSISQNLMREFSSRVKDVRKLPSENKHIITISAYISEHLYEKITVSQLSELTGLRSEYLSQLFKKETGMTLVNYINREKINEAKKLLDFTELTLVEIAELLSFSSQSYFSTIFLKQTGITPQKYRDASQV